MIFRRWVKKCTCLIFMAFVGLLVVHHRMGKIHQTQIVSYPRETDFILRDRSFHGSIPKKSENQTYVCERKQPEGHSMNTILNEAQKENQGYSYSKAVNISALNVLIIPTSHNDPGWIQTFDDYYNKQTKNILNNVVKYLTLYPSMSMIWPEVVFLERWWKEASDRQRTSLKHLISKGQLEIVSGGWVSPDEATCHYFAVLDQLIEGHQWLSRTIKIKPKSSWPLDQFGYSTTLPYIWFKAGMKNLGMLRVTESVKSYLAREKMLDFTWRQQWDTSGENDMLCHVEPYLWFVTLTGCGPDTNVCDRLAFHKQVEDLNHADIKDIAKDIVDQFKQKASLYKTNAIVVPLGTDFAYDTQKEWISQYKKMSKLIDYINRHKTRFGVNIKFGTVSEYFEIIHKESKYPVIQGDFFTYVEGGNEYWSGYFTTRPFDKRIGRILLELVRAAELSTTLAVLDSLQNNYPITNLSERFRLLENVHRELGLFQHHDAITGTSTHKTATDNRKRLFFAIKNANQVLSSNFEQVLRQDEKINVIPLLLQKEYDEPIRSLIVNITEIQTNILIWNPFTSNRTEVICIVVNDTNIEVLFDNKNEVKIQINPIWDSLGKISDKFYEVCFEINVSAASGVIYSIAMVKRRNNLNMARVGCKKNRIVSNIWGSINMNKAKTFRNKYLSVTFTAEGVLKRMCKIIVNICSKVHLDWIMYEQYPGDAYVFQADMDAKSLMDDIKNIRIVSGNTLTKVTLIHELFEHTIILYNTTSIQAHYLHIKNEVSLLSKTDNGKEMLMRIRTDIQNSDCSYFTDANGLQMVKRIYRPKMPSGANFYPMTTMAFIHDQYRRITIHSAQPLGVGSFHNGSLQILIDRRPSLSGKGLTESVLDNRPTTSTFFLQLEEIIAQDNGKYGKPSYDFPSSFSSFINDLLQNPFNLFLVQGSQHIKNEVKLFRHELSQDIVVANFRTFFTEKYTWNGTGVTFHRKWTPCEDEYVNDSKLIPSQLFNNKIPEHIYKSQLTYIHSDGKIDKDIPLHLKPMDLASYYFSWDEV